MQTYSASHMSIEPEREFDNIRQSDVLGISDKNSQSGISNISRPFKYISLQNDTLDQMMAEINKLNKMPDLDKSEFQRLLYDIEPDALDFDEYNIEN